MKNYLDRKMNDESLEITIPQENIDLIARLAEDSAIWVKLTDGGFLINEKVIPELQGVLVSINPYFVRWIDKKPDKIIFVGQGAPDGYELRCDVKLNIDGTVIGLSLPKTSTKVHLSPYLKFLKQSGLQTNRVVTRVRSKAVSSPHGKFNVAIFDRVRDLDSGQPTAPVQVDDDVIDIPVFKAAVPAQAVSSTNNPWA